MNMENQNDQTEEQKGNSWVSPLQLITNIAVVVGIAALIFELNQNRDLAQVQTFDNAYLSAMSRNLSLMGESPETSLSKAIFRPSDINQEDAVVLSQYYSALIVSWRRLKDDRAIGYFGDGWEGVVSEEAFNLNTQIGRKWWEQYKAYGDAEIIVVVNSVLDRISVTNTFNFYQGLLPDGGKNKPQ